MQANAPSAPTWSQVRFSAPVLASLPLDGTPRKVILMASVLALPLAIATFGLWLAWQGDDQGGKRALVFAGVMLAFFAALAWGLERMSKDILRNMDGRGVTTRGGGEHVWAALRYVDARHRVMKHKKAIDHFRLMFDSGSVILPLTLKFSDGSRLEDLLRQLPVPLRHDGVVAPQ